MNRKQYLVYRLVWTVVGAWGALSGIFLAFALAPDPGQYKICPGGGCRAAYRAARNYDAPLHERYLSWMEGFLTFDLGTTVRGEPIAGVLADASTVTLTYLVLSVALAVIAGVGVGLFVAMRPDSKLLRAVRAVSYVGFAIPTFVAALGVFFVAVEYLGIYTLEYDHEQALFTARNLVALTLPAGVVTVNLFAIQLRYARSESVDILQRDFIRALHARGMGTAVVVRHVLKNGATSLLSVFFSELVGVVFVVLVVVEVIFDIPGFGQLLYRGIQQRDLGIILATTTFPILLVMVGNFVQDVAYTIIDPRIESGAE
ncbi:ABC transporter permease [Halorussus amylolyticus]|uniref:ABC transporter permease n=1 Tax=Halorussus amylolyticus TaxID=1126242 RepID=UPI00104818E9|nr:ABC transporter permease [Halorussus amylolyticus]